MKHSLRDLLFAADQIFLNGYEVEDYDDSGFRTANDDFSPTVDFDQEIELVHGEAVAQGHHDDFPIELRFRFVMERPMTEEDLKP